MTLRFTSLLYKLVAGKTKDNAIIKKGQDGLTTSSLEETAIEDVELAMIRDQADVLLQCPL